MMSVLFAKKEQASSNVVHYNMGSNGEGCVVEIMAGDKKINRLAVNFSGEPDAIYLNREDRGYLNVGLKAPVKIKMCREVPSIQTLCVKLVNASKKGVVNKNLEVVRDKLVGTVVNVSTHCGMLDHELWFVEFISLINKEGTEINFGLVQETTDIILVSPDENKFELNLKNLDFEQIGVGGLEKEFKELVKSLFLTRIIPKAVYDRLGIKHTKGCLLHGPPGCGKTRTARQIGKLLNVAEKNTRVVNGPELLSKYVGESEKKIRECFEQADLTPAELHILIFDEFDALARERSNESNSDIGAKIVGQLLTMLDGVREYNNIIVFALTNRIDILDPAILRPGRFSLQLKIDLPDAKGRLEILKIHTRILAENKYLDVNFDQLVQGTGGWTGAELELLVQKTVHEVLGSNVDFSDIVASAKKLDNFFIQTKHFIQTLSKITPQFSTKVTQLSTLQSRQVKCLSEVNLSLIQPIVKQLQTSKYPRVFCLDGEPKSGKTSLLCYIGLNSNQGQIEYINAAQMLKMSESKKVSFLMDHFADQDKLLLIDDIELILEFVSEGIFNRVLLQTLKVLLNDTRHHVIITTSYYQRLKAMTILDSVVHYVQME